MNVTLKSMDLKGAIGKSGTLKTKVISMVTIAAREDTKPYVPYKLGHLRASAETESIPEQGKLIYGNADVNYARAQYYGCPNKTFPGTTKQWFDYSKAANLSKWIRIADAAKKEALRA